MTAAGPLRDPRTSGPYKRLRAAFIARHPSGSPCCLCGRPIDTSLSGMAKWGPTVEHHVPVSVLRRHAATWADLVALCCDVSTWGIAHRTCQQRQGASMGGRVIAARKAARRVPYRDW